MGHASIHETAIIDSDVHIGDGTRIWHYAHVMTGASIGANCILGQNVFVGAGVSLGSGVKVQNNVSIYTGVEIEDDVFLGPSMVFTNVINPRSFIERKQEYRKTVVRQGCSIGANATIICGVTLGEYAFIGAGAVVTTDVAPYTLVMGNPARESGFVSKAGERLVFDDNGKATCPFDGSRYLLQNGIVNTIA